MNRELASSNTPVAEENAPTWFGLMHHYMKGKIHSSALRITLVYTVLATLWILFSDKALLLLVEDPEALMRWSLYKGLAFVAFTSILLLALIEGSLRALDHSITERKAIDQALHVLNQNLEAEVAARTSALHEAMERAEEADRLKSAFLATMSHELRTPLNSIIGFTGIVLQGMAGPLNPEQTKQLGMVRNSARHLLDLINDILDLSKIEAGQLELVPGAFSLPASLQQVLTMIKPLADKKSLLLATDLDPDIPTLFNDRRRFEQILINLLNNAIKFTESGSVHLHAQCVQGVPDHPNLAETACVAITVEDTGIGIRESDMSALFQPFRQIDAGLTRQHEGTGLGLVICRRLADLMGGTLTAQSQFGKGSQFCLVLPLLPAPSHECQDSPDRG